MGQAKNIKPITLKFLVEYKRLEDQGLLPTQGELNNILGYNSPSSLSNVLAKNQNISPEAWDNFKKHFRISEVAENGKATVLDSNLYERLVAAEEDRRKKAEETAERYLKIIEQNLTALLLSSSKNQELLLKIWDEQTSDDLVMMDNQDEAAKNPKGTSSGKSDSYQIKLATARKEAQQKTGKGKHVKANR